MIRLSTKLRFGWFEGCLIALTGYGLVSACSSTSSHSVGNAPDAGGGRGGTAANPDASGGTGATGGRGGADGSGGNGGSSGTGPAGSGGMGGTEGGDASAGTAGVAGTTATGGTNGTSGTGGIAGSAGRGGTSGTGGTGGGTAGSGGRGGTSGTSGTGGTGGAPIDASPPSWCFMQARPNDVAQGDYQCLDFENGLPLAGTWAPLLSGQGARSITTARASSAPQSLLTSLGSSITAGTPQRASQQWHRVGATGVSSLTISAEINPLNFVGPTPPWTGTIDLLCASFGSGEACFSYTRGADLSFANGYTGYFVEHQYSGGPAFFYQCPVTANLTANLWSRVELRLTRNPGSIQVFVAGANAGGCSSASFLDGTTSDISFGMRAYPETPGWTVYYDNVVAAVRR